MIKISIVCVGKIKEKFFRDAIDEYYAFKNEFPESKYIKEVENIYKDAKKYVKEINE